jgi:hypothetical protein
MGRCRGPWATFPAWPRRRWRQLGLREKSPLAERGRSRAELNQHQMSHRTLRRAWPTGEVTVTTPDKLREALGLSTNSLFACIDVKMARTAGENAQPRRGHP